MLTFRQISNHCHTYENWAASRRNQQNDLCAQQRLISALASAQSDQSSLSACRKLWSLATYWAKIQAFFMRTEQRLWSDWFCHEVAQLFSVMSNCFPKPNFSIFTCLFEEINTWKLSDYFPWKFWHALLGFFYCNLGNSITSTGNGSEFQLQNGPGKIPDDWNTVNGIWP